MLFGINLTVWIVMLVCAVIAVLYVLIVDKKEEKRAEKRKYLAILMCIAIAVLATVLSKQQAYVGAPMIGLIVGILIVNIVPEGKMSKEFKSGTVFAGKRYLSLGIVFLGATLAFSDLFSAVYALPLVLFNILSGRAQSTACIGQYLRAGRQRHLRVRRHRHCDDLSHCQSKGGGNSLCHDGYFSV